jgi:hypothetical protein
MECDVNLRRKNNSLTKSFHIICLELALFAWLINHQPAVLFSQNKPATTNYPAVLFSQNKPAPTISHQPIEQAAGWT